MCRCQCIATARGPSFCTRYIPTLRMPRAGSLETTIVRVTYGPPSSGQQVRIGSLSRFTSSPRHTTSWQLGFPPLRRGGNLATSISRGSIESLPSSPSGTLRSSSSVMRRPCSSRSSTPTAIAIRRIDPNTLIATGNAERVPSSRVTCSKSSALPPPGCFITRSLISHSSSLAATGCVTRTSSPASSRRSRNSEKESMGTVVASGGWGRGECGNGTGGVRPNDRGRPSPGRPHLVPTWIAATPSVSDCHRTSRKPAAVIRAASSSSTGKLATERGR